MSLRQPINIKLTPPNSSKSQKPKQLDYDIIIQLQLQLKQAYMQIQYLKRTNKELLEKLASYERRCQDLVAIQQQLEFRKEQQKNMQGYLLNYQQINVKLREKISELEQSMHNNKSLNKKASKISVNTCNQSSLQMTKQISKKLWIEDSKLESNRKSMNESSKENHPLTPKSRVFINFDKITRHQFEQFHKIKERRKVFM